MQWEFLSDLCEILGVLCGLSFFGGAQDRTWKWARMFPALLPKTCLVPIREIRGKLSKRPDPNRIKFPLRMIALRHLK